MGEWGGEGGEGGLTAAQAEATGMGEWGGREGWSVMGMDGGKECLVYSNHSAGLVAGQVSQHPHLHQSQTMRLAFVHVSSITLFARTVP